LDLIVPHVNYIITLNYGKLNMQTVFALWFTHYVGISAVPHSVKSCLWLRCSC